ncbi:piggyBac transposable element-derived protein 4-like [Colletes gigas]|uniref:piggyBac transposable element-derived protein 4-like n=1 Tax=Colletes gigas TaxID=935657 RepID=UPI001C9B40AB|nr:piggyBac transposable element-derived protein 4-like [Colletes gigas]
MSESMNQSSAFSELVDHEDNYNDEVSSDGGSTASYSDTKPELQDFESDVFSGLESDEDDTDDRNQIISGRIWGYIPRKVDVEQLQYVSRAGNLTRRSENIESIKESFNLFINNEIIDMIVTHTNRKAEESYGKQPQKQWKPVDRIEINAFLGLLLIIGRFRESDESKNCLWTKNTAFSRQVYAAVMSCDRFKDILKYIRFDDRTTRPERKINDKLAALRDVTNIFAVNCRESYDATNAGTVDEQLVTFRGLCPFKVYMPDKPGKYGIKLWTLCDAQTFYCCNFDVHLGRLRNIAENDQGQLVVRRLTDFWNQSGRTVTTDNSFTDIGLAEDLLQNKIFLVGTVRKDKRDLPKSMVHTYSRQRFSCDCLYTTNLTLVSYIPKPRKCIVLLSSSCHHHEHSVSGPEDNYKPEIISYYNSTKNGVNTFNALLREYSCRRATRRWPLSLFLNYVDMAAYNAFVVWVTKNPAWESHVSMKKRREMFLEKLGNELYARNIERRATDFENRNIIVPRHVVNAIESTGRKLKRKEMTLDYRKRSRCYICVGNDNKYSTRCDACLQFICSAHSNIEKNATCVQCTLFE